ncbi:hypothetical protein RJ640_015897 [Escallonia rubra]|uniref:Germin-like protein n=1 Tax=Escallonia rubra TaxID=112253 RepID=A0AA88UCH3_9ASTE|nr:hypothetical protein RJ640_015897 [Escallonia rubra]
MHERIDHLQCPHACLPVTVGRIPLAAFVLLEERNHLVFVWAIPLVMRTYIVEASSSRPHMSLMVTRVPRASSPPCDGGNIPRPHSAHHRLPWDFCVADLKSSVRSSARVMTLTVVEGSLLVGFVTSNPENRLISKVLSKSDVFVFPVGLIHFQRNVGHGNAVAIGAWNTQYPGVITTASNVFRSNPPIADEVLAKAFQVDQSIADLIKSKG